MEAITTAAPPGGGTGAPASGPPDTPGTPFETVLGQHAEAWTAQSGGQPDTETADEPAPDGAAAAGIAALAVLVPGPVAAPAAAPPPVASGPVATPAPPAGAPGIAVVPGAGTGCRPAPSPQ